MDEKLRDLFDLNLERVLSGLPQRVHDLLAEVPLFVEDFPPGEVLDQLKIHHRGDLCGLYTGVPLNERNQFDSPTMPDVVTIYREGIMNLAAGCGGDLSEKKLRNQIRITVLHELGHHHGFDEDELEELGYG